MPHASLTEQQIAAIPAVLRQRHQWVCWKIETRDGKPTKVPYNAATGERAKSDDPSTWGSFDEAMAVASDGLGFMFSTEDPFVGVDLDSCRDPTTGELQLWAARRVDRFETYTEVSPSGTGVHMIGCGQWMYDWHKKRVPSVTPNGKAPAIEVYDRLRYFTVTGLPLEGTMSEVTDCGEALRELGEEFAAPVAESGPRQPKRVDIEDAELLEIARTAANSARFRRLYDDGDTSAYGGDDSAADLALCNHLAFYCGRAQSRMDRLFRTSALYREKWDERRGEQTYGQITLGKAVASCTDIYHPSAYQTGVATEIERESEQRKAPVNGRHSPEGLPPPRRVEIISASNLMEKRFPPMRWAVPNMIGEGLTLLAGAPKAGKSYMCLSVAVAVAAGGRAFGKLQVEQGQVLYLALEDSERRLQERLDDILQGDKPPAALDLSIEWPMVGAGFEENLMVWLDSHANARLVFVDVFSRVRPPAAKTGSAYDDDTRITSALQRLALPQHVALVVLHHTRKAAADDPYDMVSGTQGMTSAADGVMVLMRRRNQPNAQLHFIGRDIASQEWSLMWDETLRSWALLGEAALHRISQERKDVLKLLREMDEDLGPKEVAELLQLSYPGIRQLMARMNKDGDLARTTRGKYRVPHAIATDRRIEG